MKYKILLGGTLLMMLASVTAAPIIPIPVSASAIPCLFNTHCTNLVEDTSSPFTLPGTIGTGFLHTRVILGEPHAPAAGLFGYEYRLDLTGVALDPTVPPCFTNIVRCVTEQVEVSTNVVVCRTNAVSVTNVVACVTNRIPAITNVVCFTNIFSGTRFVRCFTNRVPARTVITCLTNRIVASNVVVCVTNRVRYFTNLVTCTTNTIPCPESSPCIRALRIPFGPVFAGLDFDTNGIAHDWAYVVTTDGFGTIAPAAITLEDGVLTLRFSPPLCPGDSSLTVGLVSRGAPRDRLATVRFSTGASLLVAAPVPLIVPRFDCDFSALAEAIRTLKLSEILAPNNHAREGRRTALLNLVREAQGAAEAGHAADVREALAAILGKADGRKHDWLTAAAAARVRALLAHISTCLDASGVPSHGDDDEDDDDDEAHDGR